MTSSIFKFAVFSLGLALGAGLISLLSLNNFINSKNKLEIKINNETIIAEVVSEAVDRERGLAGRDSIGVNEGMLFIFPEPGLYGFWMKGMKFPIDIIWIKDDNVVGFEENVSPPSDPELRDLKIYYPSEPVDKVLEIRAGQVKNFGFKVGDELRYEI